MLAPYIAEMALSEFKRGYRAGLGSPFTVDNMPAETLFEREYARGVTCGLRDRGRGLTSMPGDAEFAASALDLTLYREGGS